MSIRQNASRSSSASHSLHVPVVGLVQREVQRSCATSRSYGAGMVLTCRQNLPISEQCRCRTASLRVPFRYVCHNVYYHAESIGMVGLKPGDFSGLPGPEWFYSTTVL
jgi:hypothetical protein